MLLVIDVESFIYRACSACKVLEQDKKDRYIYREIYDIRKGLDYIFNNVELWQNKFAARDFLFVVGDKNNWRKEYCPTYKLNRKDIEKPVMYYPILNELYNLADVVSLKNLEADDTCRIIVEDNKNYPTRKILVSIDKDFKSFPCELYDPLHDEHSVINEGTAEYNLMYQVIIGDTADNYKGVIGYGEKKAISFLDSEPRTWLDVRELFRENGQLKDFEVNRNLAAMVSIDRYNFNTGEVKLLQEVR